MELHSVGVVVRKNISEIFGEETGQLKLGKKQSRYKTMNVKKWICKNCNSSFFYASLRCPACESQEIKKISVPATYNNGNYSA